MSSTEQIRRVVTATGPDGAPQVAFDGPSEHVTEIPGTGLTLTDLWITDGAPASNDGSADAADRPLAVEPPPEGSLFRIIDFPPDRDWMGKVDSAAAIGSIGGQDAAGGGDSDLMWHQTQTVDYILIVSGQIVMVSDGPEVTLEAGDTMVQRGIRHAWSNRGQVPCRMACVSVSTAAAG